MTVHGRPLPPRPDTRPLLRADLKARCWRGAEPAESLDPADRAQLLTELCAAGWTDTEIATHTRMSTHTTGRIREQLGLESNHHPREGAA
ncbi:MAG: hypothetical protein GEU83_18240 [Pseudonocardiaceae bacterium]|nr:hypothetical protein [Pseudonocardiaceae bacterium]